MFVTTLGHRLYSGDLLRTLDGHVFDGEPPGGPAQPHRIEDFLGECLGFESASVDGVLVWDTLEFLTRPLLLAIVDRLYDILKPGACLLTLFHNSERIQELPLYSYRIAGSDTVNLVSRGTRQAVQVFNSRGIERLFERFDAVKFFLTRENLREVIVRR